MALPAGLTGEIRSGGNDLNSGYFSTGGTDRSNQDSPHVTFNGTSVTATTAGVSATITITGYTVLSGDAGNSLRIASGTNFTAGLYHIDSVSTGAGTWTLDRNCTTGAGSALVGRMGGAVATPGQVGADKAAQSFASSVIYTKKASNYLISSTSNVSGGRVVDGTSGTASAPNRWLGYETTRGDFAGKPVWEANASSIKPLILNGGATQVDNIEFFRATGGGLTAVAGIECAGSDDIVARCKFNHLNSTLGALQLTSTNCSFNQCEFNDCSAAAVISAANCHGEWSDTHDGGEGFQTSGTGAGSFLRVIAANMTGDGFSFGAQGSLAEHCTAFNCDGSHGGFFFSAGSNKQAINCLSYGNAVNGFENAGEGFLTNCAGGGNGTSDNTGFLAGNVQGFVTLTADPFTSTAGNDFSLNNNAGGGILLRGAGVPGLYPGLSTTSFPDVGAAQHSDAMVPGFPFHRVYHVGRRTF